MRQSISDLSCLLSVRGDNSRGWQPDKRTAARWACRKERQMQVAGPGLSRNRSEQKVRQQIDGNLGLHATVAAALY